MIERLNMDDVYSPLENAIHLNRYELTRQFCKDKSILDLSCGEGYGSFLMAEWGAKEVTGIDISEDAIKKAKKHFKKENLKYLLQDASNLKDIKSKSFDMIVSFETFEHIKENEKYLKEIKRVAKKDAIIIISCPNDYYYYPNENASNPYHIKKYKFNEFKKNTEKVLGNNVKYMLGMETMGYTNIIFEQDGEIQNNLEITNEHTTMASKKINNGKEISAENCNYYIGLWNVNEVEENNVIFPHMYTDWKESINILEQDKKELSNLINDLKNEIKLIDEDKNILDEKTKNLEEDKNMLNEEYMKLKRENQKIKETNKILYAQNEEVRQFSYQNYCNYVNIKEQLDAILNSRSYRWTRKIVKIIRMVKRK